MNIKYSEQYDAYYDADTGEWAEVGCEDPNCEFCAGRPEKAPIETEEPETPAPWNARFSGDKDFYGCVGPDGMWFDSAESFEAAVHWCCMWAGEYGLDTVEELRWMSEGGFHKGYSVIHSSMLRKMYEAGLLK